MNEEDDPFDEYLAVVNDEEQYALWPAPLAIPGGWHEAGMRGTKDECLTFIGSVWTDMRPKSLREAMARNEAAAQQPTQ
jgi:MbtH protein